MKNKKMGRLALLSPIAASLAFAAHSDEAADINYDDSIERILVQGEAQAPLTLALSSNSGITGQADMRDILSQLPGIDVNGNGPITGVLQYRGLFGDRIAVEQQGGPIVGAGPNAMDSPISHFVARPGVTMTLQRGIAPVTTGPESIGGALAFDIDTQSLFSDSVSSWRGGLTSAFQQQGDALHYTGHLGYHTQESFVQAFYQDQDRDNVDDGDGNTIPNSLYERQIYGFDSGFSFGDHTLTAHYQVVDTGPTGTAALAMDIVYIDSERYQLGYEWAISPTRTLVINAFGNNNQHGMANNLFRTPMSPMMSRLNTVDSNAQGYEINWQETLGDSQLTVGMDTLNAKHNSTITNPELGNFNIHNFNGVERDVTGVFAQWQTTLNWGNAIAGVRYNQIDASAGPVSHSMAMMNPAVGNLVEQFNQADRELDFDYVDLTLQLNGEVTQHWQWHAGLAQKHRAPSYTELFVWFPLGISAGLADGRNYLGNLNLSEEQANKIDLGLTYQDDGISISPRLFYDDIEDYIVGSPSTNETANRISTMMTGQPPLQWSNADVTLLGADILFSASLSDSWQLNASAQYVRADRDDIDEPLFRVAPASLFSQLRWSQQQLSASVEALLVASQERTSDLVDESASAGYGVINLTADYALNEHVSISLRVDNLFDKFYQPHVNGVNRVMSDSLPSGQRLPEPGRNLVLGITLTL